MKTIKILIGLFIVFGLFSCTKDFVEINKNPNAITSEEASAKYFVTNPQYKLYAPDRYPYWRAHLIHVDRYSGHFTFGFHSCWWSDELGYSYHSSYTNAAWGWLEGYFGNLNNFMGLTGPGGDFENEYMYAAGKIIKGLYYQMFTDIFGEIPYSEAGVEGIDLPKFDTQAEIYQGIIADLDDAMATIGSTLKTGDGVEDMAENDLFCGGDLQKWKKLANTLKLRMALRAYGAEGATWAEAAIDAALSAPLLDEADGDILIEKDTEITQWNAACYGDIWFNFGAGSDWNVGEVLINYLRDNNDPRLEKYAKPAEGGTFPFTRPDEGINPDGYANFSKRINFIANIIDNATGGDFTFTEWPDSAEISVPENTYYIGQPSRLNNKIKSMARHEFFSDPTDIVIQKKQEGKPIFPEIVLTVAESYFLQAEAALLGFGSGLGGGSIQQLYQSGLTAAMALWGTAPTADFQSSPMWTLTGTTGEQLEQISIQRWIALYTDGFEAWSIVRESGYPAALAAGVSDIDIFGLGDINGDYPTRMRYGTQVQSTNLDNYNAAVLRQGADVQNTQLWWAKKVK
ncbi:MAG: SusD/RagB family nutrient-binding outer membrane lipoprotein [Bacteroidales bacterium]|nr:MAG: SusD/RagB family nutrient-binding outer membrane lipoprotein [Bacteroidales bacterium]